MIFYFSGGEKKLEVKQQKPRDKKPLELSPVCEDQSCNGIGATRVQLDKFRREPAHRGSISAQLSHFTNDASPCRALDAVPNTHCSPYLCTQWLPGDPLSDSGQRFNQTTPGRILGWAAFFMTATINQVHLSSGYQLIQVSIRLQG